ncbi:acyltransferase family protein [Gottfriedia solisilvae]|uniref:Acyltransferase n=1 Tax=Gottfriedia solisilvae TaxID=1516104 RepID=A0A8J3ARR9_9BACI|nr:acyltransferase family protein [Gottfriedia solisilvae]GGI17619.1 acyltransferase [Gottfriedia solisilvae]
MSNSAKKQFRYMPGLDGLRALAVLSVIAYHLNLPGTSGGFLGVTVFFVLSGYLITDLLIAEWSITKKIDLKNFWIRRAKRLLPGMFTLILVVIATVSIFQPSLISSLKQDSIAAVFYYSNWWYIFHDLSYFESFGPPSLLNHFWSLAVEEQFYILWPIIILIGLRFMKRKSLLFLVTITGAIISALLMALLFVPGSDPSRVYYGTDTRAFSLLIGAALAMMWPSRKLTNKISASGRITLDIMGFFGLIIFICMVCKTNQYDSFLYQGGMFLLSISTAMLIASLAHPASIIGRALAMRPLKWVGLRSYGIYLWHFPVIILFTPKIDTGEISFIRVSFQVILIFGLAALSYRFIEDPIRKGKLELIWGKVRSGQLKMKDICLKHLIVISSFILLIAISSFGISSLPGANGAKASSEIEAIQNLPKQSSQIVEKEKMKPKPHKTPIVDRDEHTSKPNQHSQIGHSTNKPVTNNNKTTKKKQSITIIGDSVVINAIPYLQKSYPTLKADAKIGRQFADAPKIIQQLQKTNSLGEVVIIELGTNGAFTKKQMISVIKSLGDKKILFVNTRVPRQWESIVNKNFKEVSSNFSKNTKVVDWYKASANHNSYFESDGVHLKPEGAKVYASLIKNAIESFK